MNGGKWKKAAYEQGASKELHYPLKIPQGYFLERQLHPGLIHDLTPCFDADIDQSALSRFGVAFQK